jgi:hypothetical protein
MPDTSRGFSFKFGRIRPPQTPAWPDRDTAPIPCAVSPPGHGGAKSPDRRYFVVKNHGDFTELHEENNFAFLFRNLLRFVRKTPKNRPGGDFLPREL